MPPLSFFILNIFRRVPTYFRWFPFFLYASACSNTFQYDHLAEAHPCLQEWSSSNGLSAELRVGLCDGPACHLAAPALAYRRVDFDPVVAGIEFDFNEHRWSRSARQIDPDEPMRSTRDATSRKERMLTDRLRRSRSYDPQKSIAFGHF